MSMEISNRSFVDRLMADHQREADRAAQIRTDLSSMGRWLAANAAEVGDDRLEQFLRDVGAATVALVEAERMRDDYRAAAFNIAAQHGWPLPGDRVESPIEAEARAAVERQDDRRVATGDQAIKAHPVTEDPDAEPAEPSGYPAEPALSAAVTREDVRDDQHKGDDQ